jgi:predicted DNA-binding transcriptional regulator YafY
VRYELRATWDLSRLVFNPDELGAHFQALRSGDARREIESLVIRLYFERRRLKAELSAADATATGMPLSGMKLELRVEEIEAELDALTGGAFTRLSRRRDDGAAVIEP